MLRANKDIITMEYCKHKFNLCRIRIRVELIFMALLLIAGCARKVPIVPYVPKETGTIQGLAYEVDGKTPISGVMVLAYDTYGYISGYSHTDIHGKYVIQDIFPESYILQIHSGEHYGTAGRYAGEYYRNAYKWKDANLISVQARKPTSNVNFLLERGGIVLGKLIDRDKNPISNTSFFLQAYSSKNSYVTYFSQTDSFGEYWVSGLEPNNYKIKIEPVGWIGDFYQGNDWEDAQTIESKFDTVTLLDFEANRGGAISGTVTPFDLGIMVQVIGKNKALEKPLDSTGYYIIEGLPEDKYLVKLSPQKDSPYAWKYYPDVSFAHQSTYISVTSLDTITGIDFELTKGGVISGEVKNEVGSPVEKFELELYTTKTACKLPLQKKNVYSPSGKYEINGIPAGEYILKINSFYDKKTYITEYYKSADFFKDATSIEVKKGYNTFEIDFKLTSAGWVQGFLFLNNDLVSREDVKFKVLAFPVESGAVIEGRNTFTGGYRVSGLSSGEYKLCAIAPNSGFAAVWIGGGRSFIDPKTEIVLIYKGNPTNINFSVILGGCEITGKVYDKSSKLPILGEVAVYDSAGYIIQLAKSSEDGYRLKGLPVGQYFIRTYNFENYKDKWYDNADLLDPDCVDTAPWFFNIPSEILSVEVKESEITTDIDFYLEPSD